MGIVLEKLRSVPEKILEGYSSIEADPEADGTVASASAAPLVPGSTRHWMLLRTYLSRMSPQSLMTDQAERSMYMSLVGKEYSFSVEQSGRQRRAQSDACCYMTSKVCTVYVEFPWCLFLCSEYILMSTISLSCHE